MFIAESKKGTKGITLIALIITIIVMLILAGVTINIIVNGGLFRQANEAAELTKRASYEEQVDIIAVTALLNRQTSTDNNYNFYKSVDDALKKQTNLEISYNPPPTNERIYLKDITNGYEYRWINLEYKTGGAIGDENNVDNLKYSSLIGAYVDYQPTRRSYTSNPSETGIGPDTVYTEENLNWRIVGVDPEGSFVQIMTEIPLSGDDGSIRLRGETGYNNAEKVLNDICYTLYRDDRDPDSTAENIFGRYNYPRHSSNQLVIS